MPSILPYNRQKAISYAEKWALKRNPDYLDFSKIGGDCTNFISQCLYAGSNKMNYTPVYGWYYITSGKRTASWSGVTYLYNFLVSNNKRGVFASLTDISKTQPGDIIQLGNSDGTFYHSLIITKIEGAPELDTVYISTHTMDSFNRPLNSYTYDNIRFLHIEGVYNS